MHCREFSETGIKWWRIGVKFNTIWIEFDEYQIKLWFMCARMHTHTHIYTANGSFNSQTIGLTSFFFFFFSLHLCKLSKMQQMLTNCRRRMLEKFIYISLLVQVVTGIVQTGLWRGKKKKFIWRHRLWTQYIKHPNWICSCLINKNENWNVVFSSISFL